MLELASQKSDWVNQTSVTLHKFSMLSRQDPLPFSTRVWLILDYIRYASHIKLSKHIPIVGIYDRSFNNMSQVKVLSLANMVVLRTYMSVGLTS